MAIDGRWESKKKKAEILLIVRVIKLLWTLSFHFPIKFEVFVFECHIVLRWLMDSQRINLPRFTMSTLIFLSKLKGFCFHFHFHSSSCKLGLDLFLLCTVFSRKIGMSMVFFPQFPQVVQKQA